MGRRDKPLPEVREDEVGMLSLGARMRYERQRRGISLTEMARRLHYTKGHLSAVENEEGNASQNLVDEYEAELDLVRGTLPPAGRGERRVRNTSGTGTGLEKPLADEMTNKVEQPRPFRFGSGYRVAQPAKVVAEPEHDDELIRRVDSLVREAVELQRLVRGSVRCSPKDATQ